MQHARARHGVRCSYRLHAPGTGVCPVCFTNFRQRVRLLGHLRLYACGRALIERPADFTPMSDEAATALDAADNALFRAARMRGGTTPLACGEARRANGRAVGAATR